ncbi:MAG: redox-sensing transcriptional repressor Rex [Blastocatellia bacterium]
MKTEKISELTINRLSIYLRCLNELSEAAVQTASSKLLAERFNLNSAQIRKDLAYFGEFGVRGVGYVVEDLRAQLRGILGLATTHRVAIVGAGNLGLALANYLGFQQDSFQIVALFDVDPARIGLEVRPGLVVQSLDLLPSVIPERQVDMVMLTVPAVAAESVLEMVMQAGVRAVLNFAPVHLSDRSGCKVKTVDLSISLESLSYFLANPTVEPQEE